MSGIFYIIFAMSFCSFEILESNAKLTIRYEDFNVDDLNEEFFDPDFFEAGINYKGDSKNSLKLKIKIIKDLPTDLRVKFNIWTGALGQYKVPIFASGALDICDPTTYKLYFDGIFAPVGINPEICPAKKGEYMNEDYYPDILGIPDVPPNILFSQIRFDLTLFAESVGDVLKLKVFVKI